MNKYMVEVTLEAVENDDWVGLRRVTDIVPGTILIEDAEEPVLILPVDAESGSRAAVFVEGVASIVGLTIIHGHIGDAPDDDFDPVDHEGDLSGDQIVEGFEPKWLVSA